MAKKIANCPVCGKEPEVWCRDEEWRIRITCCRHVVYSTDGWNRYAAAMVLAVSYAESVNSHVEERQAHIALGDHPDWLILAQQRVLEVFK